MSGAEKPDGNEGAIAPAPARAPTRGTPPHRRTTLALFAGPPAPATRDQDWLDSAFGTSHGPEAMEVPVLCIDVEGCVIQSNPAARAIMGDTLPATGPGGPLADAGLHIPSFDEWLAKLSATRQPLPASGTLITGPGMARPFAATGLYLPEMARVLIWLAVEEPVAGREAPGPDVPALKATAEAARIGFVINTRDADGVWRLTYLNGTGAQILGQDPVQVLGGGAFPPRRILPNAGDAGVISWRTSAGERRLEIGIGVASHAGLDAEYVMFRDITDGQPNEAERKRLVQELFNANVDLRNFARATTHDLRAPLRSIAGFAALLERRIRGRLDDDDVRLINNIISSTRRMDQLIEALAAFSAIGSREFDKSHVELNTVLGDVLSDLASELDQEDIHLEFTSLPSLEGDALLLRQLFQNLLGNAIKFRNQVPHRVRLDAEYEEDWLLLRFADNGVGIDLARAKELFQPFRRFHDPSRFPGSGLGLATCKRIVELHGGSIDVASEPGQGSTFTVRLPS